MDLMSKFNISASMLLTGFAIVFGVLLLLIFIIWLYGTIVSNAQNKAAEIKAAKEIKKQNIKPKEQKPTIKVEPKKEIQPESKDDEIPEEIVAVISAAVYSMYGSKQKVKIKSVKRRRSASAWANTSMLENNQPFVF